MKWISVEDRLPKKSTALNIYSVLIWLDNRVQFGWYIERLGWRVENSTSCWGDEIKYWMPLPDSPNSQQT